MLFQNEIKNLKCFNLQSSDQVAQNMYIKDQPVNDVHSIKFSQVKVQCVEVKILL